MEDYEIVEELERCWPDLPKDKVCVIAKGKAIWHRLAYSIGNLMFLHEVREGIRGGLSENLIVVDAGFEITAERLVLKYQSNLGHSGALLELPNLRAACFGQTALLRANIICRALLKARDRLFDMTDQQVHTFLAAITSDYSESITYGDRLPGAYGTGRKR